ncbi:MAG: hypothetical protein WDM88_05570 [Galbitalea sp.]
MALAPARLEGSLILAAVAIAAGQLARALAPNAAVLIVATALTLVGAGIGNVLLRPSSSGTFRIGLPRSRPSTPCSSRFRRRCRRSPAFPVASAFGWRASLALWFVLALTVIAPWIVASASTSPDEPPPAGWPRGIPPRPSSRASRRSRAAVPLARGLGHHDHLHGVDHRGVRLTCLAAQSPRADGARHGSPGGRAARAVRDHRIPGLARRPYLASRLRNVGILLYVALACLLIGYAGLLIAPAAAPVLWVVIAGIGPMLFPLALFLITARTRTHAGSVALSGFVQGVGYVIGAFSPLTFGLLDQATGGWSLSLLFLIVVSLAALPAGIILTRKRYLEDDLAR